jgi:cyclohexanone monooxygenase
MPGFPNFFMLAGPNTGIGHNSALDMLECQIDYATRVIDFTEKNSKHSLEVNEKVEAQYNDWVQRKLKNTVWLTGGCNSWYLNKAGKNTTLYPTYNYHFRRACRNFKAKNFLVR